MGRGAPSRQAPRHHLPALHRFAPAVIESKLAAPPCLAHNLPRLEGSLRIRGKGLTHFTFASSVQLSRTFFVPPVCGSRRTAWRTAVAKKRVPRPNLEHLRRQAKALLSAL